MLFEVSESDKISVTQALAQAFEFFLAGYESAVSTITYTLYELAINQRMQEKLYIELAGALEQSGKITFDILMNRLELLDMVVCGT